MKLVLGFLNFFFFFVLSDLKNKNIKYKKETNCEPPRVSGARKQYKKLPKVDPFLVTSATDF